MSDVKHLIEEYSRGPTLLRAAVAKTPDHAWDSTPIQNAWSIRQVVCHLADSEIVYADRMKRVLVEDNPTFFEADPDQFVPALYCDARDGHEELAVVETIRSHMLPILRSCGEREFARGGVHSLDGPMNLTTLLSRITSHIPHHVKFIEQKLAALNV